MSHSLPSSARLLRIAAWTLALLIPAAARPQVRPEGPRVRIDPGESVARIAVDPLGRFGASWDMEGLGVGAFRTFDRKSQPLVRRRVVARPGPDSRIFSAALAADGSGDFLLSWHDRNVYTEETALFVRFVDVRGKPLSAPIELDAGSAADWKVLGDVARARSGEAIVVWMSRVSGRYLIRYQKFDARQRPVRWNRTARAAAAGGYLQDPLVAMDDGGRFVVAWRQGTYGVESDRYFLQRYGADGEKLGATWLLTRKPYTSLGMALGMEPDGELTAVWIDNARWVRARWFDSQGLPLSDEETVRASDQGQSVHRPALARDRFGNTVVLWDRFLPDASSVVEGRVFDRLGTPLGPFFQVGFGVASSVGIDDDGRFVVAWTEVGQPGQPRVSTVAQRYRLTCAPGYENRCP